jgi:alpha-ketoglutarate-dependent taurine dioxygenase
LRTRSSARIFATGLKALYVTAGECVAIEGMANDEAVALIGELHDHCLKPEFQYRHKWQVGDLLMWDNAASILRAAGPMSLLSHEQIPGHRERCGQ